MQRDELIRAIAMDAWKRGIDLSISETEDMVRQHLAGVVLVEMETAEDIVGNSYYLFRDNAPYADNVLQCVRCQKIREESDPDHKCGCAMDKLRAAVEAAKGGA